MQIGTSTRSELGSFCAWSGLELDSSSGWSGSKLVCGSKLVSSTAWSGSERFSSSAWSGSELVSFPVWNGSELGSFELRRCGVDRSLAASTATSLDRGASVWVVPFGSVCGSDRLNCVGVEWIGAWLRRAWIVVRRCGWFRLARCVGRSSEGLTEAVCV